MWPCQRKSCKRKDIEDEQKRDEKGVPSDKTKAAPCCAPTNVPDLPTKQVAEWPNIVVDRPFSRGGCNAAISGVTIAVFTTAATGQLMSF